MTGSRALRLLSGAASLWCVAAVIAGATQCAAAETVKVGYFPTYLPSEIEARILSSIAATYPELGVPDLKLVGTDVAASWVGIQRGDIDVLIEVDLPNQQTLLDKGKSQIELLSRIYGGADQGFFVPRYVVAGADAPARGLQSVARLADYAVVFGGKVYDEAPGWKSTKYNDMRLKAYAPQFEHIELSDAALVAQVSRAIDRKQPVVFFFYHPHWLFKVHDLVKLTETDPYHAGCFENGVGRCAVPDFSAWVGARKSLAATSPKFYAMLRNFTIPMVDIEAMMFKVTREKEPISRAAAEWVSVNRRDVDRWTQHAVAGAQ